MRLSQPDAPARDCVCAFPQFFGKSLADASGNDKRLCFSERVYLMRKSSNFKTYAAGYDPYASAASGFHMGLREERRFKSRLRCFHCRPDEVGENIGVKKWGSGKDHCPRDSSAYRWTVTLNKPFPVCKVPRQLGRDPRSEARFGLHRCVCQNESPHKGD